MFSHLLILLNAFPCITPVTHMHQRAILNAFMHPIKTTHFIPSPITHMHPITYTHPITHTHVFHHTHPSQHLHPITHAHPQFPLCTSPVHINAVGFMQQHFKDLLDNKKYVDVTFVLEGQPIPAHRLILASQSDYFDRLFYGKVKEATSSDEIPLPNVPLEAFRLLLEFMYSGCLDYDNQPLQVGVM